MDVLDDTGSSNDKKDAMHSGYEQLAGLDPADCKVLLAGVHPNGEGWTGEPPTRTKKVLGQTLRFVDFPEFRPNLTPAEVLRSGSFGGGYFRPINSGVTGVRYRNVWKELPAEWLEGIEISTQIASPVYRKATNLYGVDCGAKTQPKKQDSFGQKYWEQQGWIAAQDPYGWFHWYCRFFQGRRSSDDRRQVDRWCRVAGKKGRWKSNLIGKCLKAGKAHDDVSVSPVVRQTLQHWAYRLTAADFKTGAKRVRAKGAAYIPREQLAGVMNKSSKKKKK